MSLQVSSEIYGWASGREMHDACEFMTKAEQQLSIIQMPYAEKYDRKRVDPVMKNLCKVTAIIRLKKCKLYRNVVDDSF